MLEVRQTAIYASGFAALRDRQARFASTSGFVGSLGNPGDVKPVGEGRLGLRVDYGPGYRVYFVQRGKEFVVLLAGGDKSSQDRDIRQTKALAREL